MTESQLETLATEVMGWKKRNLRDAHNEPKEEYWVIVGETSENSGEVVMLVKDFHPDTDLKQTLPLLDEFNSLVFRIKDELFLEIRNEAVNHWELTETSTKALTEEIIATTSTKDLAPTLTTAIYERVKA